jgi:quercetin dioxygenase-like cupin family protein
MIFNDLSSLPEKELIPGFHGKFIHGDSLTIAFWQVKAGSVLPEHSHIHEQISMVDSGQFEMTIGERTEVLTIGKPVVIPSGVPHSGKALTDCVIRDVFCPARPEYS